MTSDDDSVIELAELLDFPLEELEKWLAARKLKLENPWVLDLIKVLYSHPSGLSRSVVLHMVQSARRKRGQTLPEALDETIQSAFQRYCVDSKVFTKRKAPAADALFHWPKGAGAGVWAIYPEKAEAWLRNRGIRL